MVWRAGEWTDVRGDSRTGGNTDSKMGGRNHLHVDVVLRISDLVLMSVRRVREDLRKPCVCGWFGAPQQLPPHTICRQNAELRLVLSPNDPSSDLRLAPSSRHAPAPQLVAGPADVARMATFTFAMVSDPAAALDVATGSSHGVVAGEAAGATVGWLVGWLAGWLAGWQTRGG